jgi:hypothetical protein
LKDTCWFFRKAVITGRTIIQQDGRVNDGQTLSFPGSNPE